MSFQKTVLVKMDTRESIFVQTQLDKKGILYRVCAEGIELLDTPTMPIALSEALVDDALFDLAALMQVESKQARELSKYIHNRIHAIH